MVEKECIQNISAEDVIGKEKQGGLVLQGCGGDLLEWQNGINELLTGAGILQNGTSFHKVYAFENEGLTNLLFPFNKDVDIDFNRLATWRLQTHEQFGGTWISDYIEDHLTGSDETQDSETTLQ